MYSESMIPAIKPSCSRVPHS